MNIIKNKLLLCITFLMSLFVFTGIVSADTCLNDKFQCTKDEDLKTAKLTKYVGTDKNVIIPAIDGEYIVIVGSAVFQNNQTVESIKFTKSGVGDPVIADTSITNLFYGAENLKSVDLNNFDTSNTTNMSFMFNRCSSLTILDVSPLDTSNVTKMNSMFGICYDLKEIDLSNFDTSKVIEMDSIFNSDNLEKIILGPKADLHVKKTDEAQGSSFGRGSWKKESDGKIYSALEISEATSNGKGAGTYTKVSDISDEIIPSFNATYKMGNFTTITKTNGSDNFFLVDNGKSLLYKIDLFDGDKTITDESVTVLLKNSVVDSKGNKYNLQIKFDNFKFENFKLIENSTIDTTYVDLLNIKDNGIMISNYTYDTVEDFESGFVSGRREINKNQSSTSYDVEMKVLGSDGKEVEGSYIFSAYDLDISAYLDKDSEYKYLYTDNFGFGSHSEGVNLISGFDKDTITLAKNTFLTKTVKDAYTRITGTRSDNVSEYSEFVVKADSKDFKFRWTSGRAAYTLLLAYYQPKSVLIENVNEKAEFLKDSKFEMYDANNKKVAEWTTDGKEGNTFFLNPGKYTVKQISVVEPYELEKETIFYVDIEDKLTMNSKSVEKIVIVNKTVTKEETKEEKIQEETKCSTKVIDGKTHYYDTKGNEIDKSEWSNKCEEPVPTGSFAPIIKIAVGIIFIVSSVIITKKQNKLKRI